MPRAILAAALVGVAVVSVALAPRREAAQFPAWRWAELPGHGGQSGEAVGNPAATAAAPAAAPAPAGQAPAQGARGAPAQPAAGKASPAAVEARWKRAYALADRGDLAGAIREFRAVIAMRPGRERCAMAEFQIGSCLEATQQPAQALRQYQRLPRLYPESYLASRAQERLNECRLLLLQREPDQAFLGPVFCDQVRPDPRLAVLCGPECLRRVLAGYGISATAKEIARLAGTTPRGTTMLGLLRAAQKKGLQARGMLLGWEQLGSLPKPSLLWSAQGAGHYLVLEGVPGRRAQLYDPQQGPITLSREDLERIWKGHALVLSRSAIPDIYAD